MMVKIDTKLKNITEVFMNMAKFNELIFCFTHFYPLTSKHVVKMIGRFLNNMSPVHFQYMCSL